MEQIIYIKDKKITNIKKVREVFMSLPDGRYLMKINSNKKRSNQQNRYFHSVIVPLVFQGLRDAGYDDVRTHEDAKSVIKNLFLKKDLPSHSTGEVIEIIQDTSKLSTIEFNMMIEEVIKWGTEFLNVQIPYPNEKLELFH